MDNADHHNHVRFAGRFPAGTSQNITVAKKNIRHIRKLPDGREDEVLSIGLACSECFSGPNLAKILRRGLDYELKVMEDLQNDKYAAPLSIHTSGGVPAALNEFIDALEPFLPWNKTEELDWCVSLQLEGASAVWAAIDMLLQVQMMETGTKNRNKVAVAGTSYHGPPSTSFGAACPLWTKEHQLVYPAPKVATINDEAKLLVEFEAFLGQHAHEIGVLLAEPQWGSSQAGMPWPKSLLQQYITMAQSRGIKVVCDEIMCGLGRHGQGTLFVSEAWDLNPDAITFGKAIGGGVFPLSGAVLKRGRTILGANQATVMQSHTYAGSSVRALMTATDVLREIPAYFASIAKLGQEMDYIFRYVNKISEGLVSCNGQGLMWGGVFSRQGQCSDETYRNRVIAAFKKHCQAQGLIPYLVPVGGFMVSPVIDIDVGTIYEIGERFEKVMINTMADVGWTGQTTMPALKPVDSEQSFSSVTSETSATELLAGGKEVLKAEVCLEQFHQTKTCTACSEFVSGTVRSKFLQA